jgi:hypothetical protein
MALTHFGNSVDDISPYRNPIVSVLQLSRQQTQGTQRVSVQLELEL